MEGNVTAGLWVLAFVLSVFAGFLNKPKITAVLYVVLTVAAGIVVYVYHGVWPIAVSLYWAFMAGRTSKEAWPRRS